MPFCNACYIAVDLFICIGLMTIAIVENNTLILDICLEVIRFSFKKSQIFDFEKVLRHCNAFKLLDFIMFLQHQQHSIQSKEKDDHNFNDQQSTPFDQVLICIVKTAWQVI